jgi:ABC-type polysaccharide/polyol phosphate export permease
MNSNVVYPALPMGLGWVFSALGVYICDTAQFIGLIVTALMSLPQFLSLDSIAL